MKVLIFGTGKYFSKRKEKITNEQIIAFLDNDSSKQGILFEGKPVYSPQKVQEIEFDYIVIMTTFYDEMRLQLEQLDVGLDKILRFEDFCLVDAVVNGDYEKYFDELPSSIGKEVLLGKRICQNGEELWQYYDFLKALLEKVYVRDSERAKEYEVKLRTIFETQMKIIDMKKLWNK